MSKSLLISNNLFRSEMASRAIRKECFEIDLSCTIIPSNESIELFLFEHLDVIYLDASCLSAMQKKQLEFFEKQCGNLWIFFIDENNIDFEKNKNYTDELHQVNEFKEDSPSKVHFFKWIKNGLSTDTISIAESNHYESDKKTVHNQIKKIAVPTMDGYLFIQTDEIIRCEARGAYTVIYSSNGKKIISSRNIKEFEESMGLHSFFRVHQSHLINLNKVQRYLKGRGGTVVMEDGSSIEVASRRKNDFLNLFEKSR